MGISKEGVYIFQLGAFFLFQWLVFFIIIISFQIEAPSRNNFESLIEIELEEQHRRNWQFYQKYSSLHIEKDRWLILSFFGRMKKVVIRSHKHLSSTTVSTSQQKGRIGSLSNLMMTCSPCKFSLTYNQAQNIEPRDPKG